LDLFRLEIAPISQFGANTAGRDKFAQLTLAHAKIA
jgi:hypothetical protein